MRIISSDRRYDFQYEKIIIEVDDNFIFAHPAFDVSKNYLIARYSTKEKAEKAMQKLRECYTGVLLMQNVSLPEDEAERLKNMTTGFICVNNREDNVRIEPMHMVFRFPQEDEI